DRTSIRPEVGVVIVERREFRLCRESAARQEQLGSGRAKDRHGNALTDVHPYTGAAEAIDEHDVIAGRPLATVRLDLRCAGAYEKQDDERKDGPATGRSQRGDSGRHAMSQ